ncbi:MAG: class I SAM-dependent methyltransferase [Candidatus Pacebacteria bacterium]|nr:class I SAM-dependent methyltransferase [Candidatus Paceibacterota bacterium]
MEGFLNPNEILKQVDLKESQRAADFGAGSGGWVIPLAKKLEDGKVFALDILEEPLSALKAKMKLEKVSNIETIVADIEKGTRILSETLDLVLMTNLLFECQDKKSVLSEGKRVLRNGGKILIIDWKKESLFGPKGERVSTEDLKRMTQELGMAVEKEFDAGAYHYGLILVK